MSYTKRIGFIVGPYLKLASVQEYEKQIRELTKLEEGTFEIKKDLIYERNARTKALVIYAVENKAQEIDQIVNQMCTEEMKYVSFRLTTLQMRISAM